MGADLLLAYVWTTEPEKIDWPKGRAEVAYLNTADVALDDFDFTGAPEDDTQFMDEVVRPQVYRDLEELKAYWEGLSDRATDTYQFGPVRALISGGTSWGEDPSEMWTVIVRMPQKVLEACGFLR
jgi:hypothetical protein